MMIMVSGDVTMVTELQEGSGAYSTDNVIVMVVHCASILTETKSHRMCLVQI